MKKAQWVGVLVVTSSVMLTHIGVADMPPHMDNPPCEEVLLPTITYAVNTHSGTAGQFLRAIDENENFK